ncbi:MAG: molybdopterin-dependent oxidoreductase [Pseudonocardiaceae bacterium]
MQGWTAVAQWGGVPLSAVLELVGLRPQARYVVFYAMDDKGLTEGEGRMGMGGWREDQQYYANAAGI